MKPIDEDHFAFKRCISRTRFLYHSVNFDMTVFESCSFHIMFWKLCMGLILVS